MKKTRTVAFDALILEVNSKSLRSGDKSTRVVLEINDPKDADLDMLNRLHRADRFVVVGIAERPKERVG